MTIGTPLIEAWRGDFLESVHTGHVVIADTTGQIVKSWGDPDKVILPRSAVKMVQALPLVESGAADAAGLEDERISLACASHIASPIHTRTVNKWLEQLGLNDSHLACGPQTPRDRGVRHALIREEKPVCRVHNNCSGKHSGMLTLARHLGADLDYVAPDHPVQRAILDAFEDLTGEESRGFGIDGCSAPNFAFSLGGFAKAMAFFAGAQEGRSARETAAVRIRRAMATNPHMVNGEGQSCTELMRAMGGKVTIKTGAEGSYTAIIPELGLGVALKVDDGATRAQQSAITAVLVHLGVLDPEHPAAKKFREPVVKNYAGLEVGRIRVAEGFV